MTFPPDDSPESPTPEPDRAAVRVEGRALSPVQFERSSAAASDRSETGLEGAPAAPDDPAWNGWDVLRLVILTIVALFVGVFTVLLVARWKVYPHTALGEIAHVPLVVIAGQALAYLLVLAYMYILVTR